MVNVILCSDSDIKNRVLQKWLEYMYNEDYQITKLMVDSSKIAPNQPIDIGGMTCCFNRIQQIEDLHSEETKKNKYIVSIENSLNIDETKILDVVNIAIKDLETGQIFSRSGHPIEITFSILDKYPKFINALDDLIQSYKNTRNKYIFNGCETTLGSLINKYYSNIPKDNWMKVIFGKDRVEQIYNVLLDISDEIESSDEDVD